MEEKIVFARAYNAGVLIAKDMGIINEEESDDLLRNPKPIADLYSTIYEKTNPDKFKKYIGLHAIAFIAPKNNEPTHDGITAIERYHSWLRGYFNGINIKKEEDSIEITMVNCPYEKVCNSAGFCIRKEAIEAATEIMTNSNVKIEVKREMKEIDKTTYTLCTLTYKREKIPELDEIERVISTYNVSDKTQEIIKKEMNEYSQILRYFFEKFENINPPSIDEVIKEHLKH